MFQADGIVIWASVRVCTLSATSGRAKQRGASLEAGEQHPQAESNAVEMLVTVRRWKARGEAVDIQRPADPAATEGDLVRRLQLGPRREAAEWFEVGVPVGSDVLRALDVVEPPRELTLERH